MPPAASAKHTSPASGTSRNSNPPRAETAAMAAEGQKRGQLAVEVFLIVLRTGPVIGSPRERKFSADPSDGALQRDRRIGGHHPFPHQPDRRLLVPAGWRVRENRFDERRRGPANRRVMPLGHRVRGMVVQHLEVGLLRHWHGSTLQERGTVVIIPRGASNRTTLELVPG